MKANLGTAHWEAANSAPTGVVASCAACIRLVTLGLVAALGLSGCATPVALKAASSKQLELLATLDQGVRELQSSLDAFHQQSSQLIIQEGRMLIAQQAIDLSASNSPEHLSADQLFDGYRSGIQPWIDGAFQQPITESRIAQLERLVTSASDARTRVALEMRLDDLRLQLARLGNKPAPVADLEAVILAELDDERGLVATHTELLAVLRTQIALMESMQSSIDDWLTIDVGPTQEQVDALAASLRQMRGASQ